LTTSNRFERLSSDFERTRELLRDPGLAAAIVENGRVVWRRSELEAQRAPDGGPCGSSSARRHRLLALGH